MSNANGRRVPLATRLVSVLATPAGPFVGAALAYRIYHPPRRAYHRQPADLGLSTVDVQVPLPDGGGELHTWLCAGDPERVVVVGHGIGLSKSASLAHARFLRDAGYTVCLFDHRNHGRSSQVRAVRGLSRGFTDDVAAVVAHLRAMPEYATARFAVYGFSFSTFPCLFVLTRTDCPVAAVVCDSGPSLAIPPLFRNFLDTPGVPVPAALRVPPARYGVQAVFASLGTAMLGRVWPPAATGAYLDTPLLFLPGEQDPVVPPDLVEALAARYPKAELWTVPGAGHLQGLKTAGDRYAEVVLDFLGRALP